MAVKSVEMVHKIRDKHYEETKGLSVAEEIQYIKEKSRKLKEQLRKRQRSTTDKIRLYEK
ncbi:MAG: hypothetical protein HY959_02030 [Ignavibacteriae bacterium]|nr:hypothetical protein [Ignavibacteriota bacterium]